MGALFWILEWIIRDFVDTTLIAHKPLPQTPRPPTLKNRGGHEIRPRGGLSSRDGGLLRCWYLKIHGDLEVGQASS